MQQRILKIFVMQDKNLLNYIMIILKLDAKQYIKQNREQDLKY